MQLAIEQRRGGHLESTHPISAVLVESSGRVVERIGPPITTTWRSGAKPLQLEVSAGLLAEEDVAALDAEDLAVGAASHSGQPEHTARVETLLERFGLTTEALYCGTHWPMHEDSGRQLLRAGHEACVLHNNCSGKHTFMAAAARRHGWDPDYRPAAHPVQRRIYDQLQQRTQGAVIDAVVDGCGVACWILPITGMATGFAQLARAMNRGEGELLGRIGWAMQRHPHFVSGTGREDGDAVAGASRQMVAKVGAEGLMCGALVQEGLGFALKAHSGNPNARAVGLQAVLARWFPGLLDATVLAEWAVLRNVIGRAVGERVAVWRD